MALALGCGLAVEDLALVRGRDITGGPGGRALVTVGGRRPRTVMCRYAYEELLLTSTRGLEPDTYAFRPHYGDRSSKHLASDWLTTHPRHTGRNRTEVLQPQRLRTAYLLGLLHDRLPLPVILRAAGVKSLHSLSRYVEFLPDVPDGHALELMRGTPE
ncbi:hypothetical protein ACFV4P_26895 [Kitasatospora sp. NPDC059795]|uniref:hypothetical protein n=1 Tax=Kitasatospora sp. NPDC059795 TaxID=3346949 RepID=UPI003665F217